jgi:hypothetical protein
MSFGQAFKAARSQGLKTFPWKGGSYSTAQAGENKALDKGIARNAEQRANAGKPGYDEVGRPGGGIGRADSSIPQAAEPAPAPAPAPAKPLPPPQTGAAGQAARVNAAVDKRVQQSTNRNIAQSAASGAPVTGGGPKVDRSTFEESVDQMRRLSTMLKG